MYDLSLDNALIKHRYHVRRRIRCGSYTEVFLGFDQVRKQVVILKALNPTLKGTPDAALEQRLTDYFQTEAEVLMRLQHPSIITLLEADRAEDLEGRPFHYLVLEYMAGGDLMTLCRKRPLSLERALAYTEQICSGLSCAHQHGVIHRDIKPQNLLLDAERQRVKISDFGIAKVLHGDHDEITRGIGTETYAPPECFDLEQREAGLTPAADIYGLAKTLYVMLTSEAPREFFQRPVAQLPPSLATRPYGPDLFNVIHKATQHNPSDRYPDVDAFWQALEPLAHFASAENSDEVDEHTVMPGSRSIKTTETIIPKAELSAARVEVSIEVEPAQILDESTIVRPASPPSVVGSAVAAAPTATSSNWSRRLFTVGLASSFIASSFLIYSVFSGGWPRRRGIVLAGNLNLRDDPGTASATIGTIPKGKLIKVLRISRDNQWCEVEADYWDGRTWRYGRGWVSAYYVQLEQE